MRSGKYGSIEDIHPRADNTQGSAKSTSVCPSVTEYVAESLKNSNSVTDESHHPSTLIDVMGLAETNKVEEPKEFAPTNTQSIAQPETLHQDVTQALTENLENYLTVTTSQSPKTKASDPVGFSFKPQMWQNPPTQQNCHKC